MSDTKKEITSSSSDKKIDNTESNEQAARRFLTTSSSLSIDPRTLLRDLDKSIKKYNTAENKNDAEKELLTKMNEALPVVALDTHYALAAATIEDLRPFAIDFANQLVTEYECKTATEKALAEAIAAAYIRILEFTGYMTRMVRDKHCSMILSGTYKVASQELDRANRHFLNAVATLKQLKTPVMNIQVKATNAFVAQNQQVNTTSPESSTGNEKVYETVDPK